MYDVTYVANTKLVRYLFMYVVDLACDSGSGDVLLAHKGI